MRDRALPLVLIPLLLAPLAATSPPAGAQSINRCAGADGTTIFTDKSCAAFGARPTGEIAWGGADAGDLRAAPSTLGPEGAVGGFAIRGCARTQGELIAGVRGAIESGDVNRLTNYYHWTGVSASAAVGLLDRLDKVVRDTMSGVQFDYAPTYEYATASMPAPGGYGPAAADAAHPAYRQAADYVPRAYEATAERAVPVADVAYAPGPSYLDRYRHENDDVPVLSSGVVDASTPLADVQDEIQQRLAAAARADDPAPVAVAGYPESQPNPAPVALRVNNGGGGGTRFSLRQNAGCWFLQF